MQIAKELLGHSNTPPPVNVASLGSIFDDHFDKKAEEAKSLFLSLKKNSIHQSFVAMFQFLSSNLSGTIVKHGNNIVTSRTFLFEQMKIQIFNPFLLSHRDLNEEIIFNTIE